jgi:hypothetical protein
MSIYITAGLLIHLLFFSPSRALKISEGLPQAGIGYNVISNLGPETEANSPFPTLNLQIGINF